MNLVLLQDSHPLWMQWWFYLILAVLAWIGVRWRIRSMVSQQNRLRSIVRRKTEDLRRETDRAVRSERVKEQFLANMSHEIRTPMNAILGMTRLLLDSEPRQEQMRYLQAIEQSSKNLLLIINDILDLSRIEAGKLPITPADFDLVALIQNLEDTLRFAVEQKDLELSVELDGRIPRYLHGDAGRLNQVLINLAGNAVKFTQKGFVKIRVGPARLAEGMVRLRFEIADSGIGIAIDKQEQIFEQFTQAESDTARRYGGSGLGLAISKRIVELQSGSIGLDSRPGKGSTFWFELDFELAYHPPEKAGTEAPLPAALPRAGLSILVAEDNAFNQMVAVDSLTANLEDAKVDVAANGLIAVEMVRAGSYDLVLMDLQMPEMDGHEASRLIRKEEETEGRPFLPIIAMTANVLPTEVERCFASGMNGFIAKPFAPEELIGKIAELLPDALLDSRS